MPSQTDTLRPASGQELNLVIIQPLVAYLDQHLGQEAVAQIATESGLTVEAIRRSGWGSLAAVEAVFAAARRRLESDQAFVGACAHDIVKSYGPMAIVLRAATVGTSYRLLAQTMRFVSKISRYELAGSSARSVVIRYRSERAESRLMCLSRQAQLPTMPLIWWGLAPAHLHETRCIAHGDDCCEYELSWSEPLAWRWPLAGALVGGAGSLLEHFAGMHGSAALPIIGLLVGAIVALRRMVKDGRDFHSGTNERVAALVEEHQQATEDIIKLHHRQEAFNALLADRIDARTATLEAMVNELKSRDARSEVALKTATHDMRNPLQVALLNAQALESENDPEVRAIAKLIQDSVLSVEAQMKRLLAIAQADDKAFEIHNKPMDVERFTERVRRNLQALVLARDIRTSTFRTRESPERIETDVMLFDRVIDNLISNAVKYTERGSILAEVGGTPGHLTFKISDTGRGISPERLEKVFVGGQRDARPLLGESHGIGLSSAIRLLDEIGGRLEVMSKPGVGTTIWAHVPIAPPKREKGRRTVDVREVLRRVVTIRQAANQ